MKRIAIAIVLSCSSLLVLAERYSVKEDGFGNYSAELVDQAESAPESSKSELKPPVPLSESSDSGVIKEQEVEEQEIEEQELINEASSTDETQGGKQLSIFERKFIESEQKEKAAALEKILQNKAKQPPAEPTFNEADYIDGEVLLEQGGRRDGQKSPYYTTVDIDGRPQNIYYDPVAVKKALAEQKKGQSKELTAAKVYKKMTSNESAGVLVLPTGADPIASKILGSGEKAQADYFDTFAKNCCANLPALKVPVVEKGRSQSFELPNDELQYRFSEGDSRYLLLRLPDDTKNYPLRVRSFIRKYKNKSIDHGVFFPQLITLDAEKNPLRVITEPVLKYVPETWTTYGYLQGIFEIDMTFKKEELYLLINTTSDLLKQSSTMEDENSSIRIAHMPTGSFEVEVLLDDE